MKRTENPLLNRAMVEKHFHIPDSPFFTKKLEELLSAEVDYAIKVSPPMQRSEEEERLRRRGALNHLIEAKQLGQELKAGIETLVELIDQLDDVTEYLPVLQSLSKLGAVVQVKDSLAKEGEPEPLQKLLGISDLCMQLIYRLTTSLFERGEFAKCSSLSSVLTILNPLVYAYWIAYALSTIHQERYQEALLPLAVATLLNPEEPAPRLWSAECYLCTQDFNSAQAELIEAEHLISSKGIEGWGETMARIKSYIPKRRSL